MSSPNAEQTHEPAAGLAERIAAVYAHRRPIFESAGDRGGAGGDRGYRGGRMNVDKMRRHLQRSQDAYWQQWMDRQPRPIPVPPRFQGLVAMAEALRSTTISAPKMWVGEPPPLTPYRFKG